MPICPVILLITKAKNNWFLLALCKMKNCQSWNLNLICWFHFLCSKIIRLQKKNLFLFLLSLMLWKCNGHGSENDVFLSIIMNHCLFLLIILFLQVAFSDYFMMDPTMTDMMRSVAERLDPQKLSQLLTSPRSGGLIAATNVGTWFVPSYKNVIQACKSIMQGKWQKNNLSLRIEHISLMG